MKNYELIVYTDEYVGNFERELCAWLFGYHWFCHEWIDELAKKADEELTGGTDENVFDEILHNFYDEHGMTVCSIGSNSNNLHVYFDKDPSKYVDIIVERLGRFNEEHKKVNKFASNKLKFLKVVLKKNYDYSKIVYTNEKL